MKSTWTSSPAVRELSAVNPCRTVALLVVTVKLGPEPGSSVRLVPLTETTVAICCMPVPFWLGGGTAVAGGTGITLKTGVTVAVVPEIATDCAASRSKSSEVLEFETVNGVGKVKVKEVVASEWSRPRPGPSC